MLNLGIVANQIVAAAPFDPLSPTSATCKCWLDMSDTSTITHSSNAVSQVDDKSTNSNDWVQSTASNKPTTNTSTINSLNVISFDGGDNLDGPTPSSLGMQTSNYEMFVVMQSSTSSTQFLLAGGYEDYELYINGGFGVRFIGQGTPYSYQGSAGDYSDGNPHYLGARVSSGLGTVRGDGTDGNTVSGAQSSDNTAMGMGGRNGGSGYNGFIAEVIIYDDVLSSGDRSDLEDYLITKWGIT